MCSWSILLIISMWMFLPKMQRKTLNAIFATFSQRAIFEILEIHYMEMLLPCSRPDQGIDFVPLGFGFSVEFWFLICFSLSFDFCFSALVCFSVFPFFRDLVHETGTKQCFTNLPASKHGFRKWNHSYTQPTPQDDRRQTTQSEPRWEMQEGELRRTHATCTKPVLNIRSSVADRFRIWGASLSPLSRKW